MKKFLFTSTLIASALCSNIAIADHHGPCHQNNAQYNEHCIHQNFQQIFNSKQQKLIIKMNILDKNKDIYAGEIIAVNTPYGVAFYPNLKGIKSAGLHGFHVHEKASCGATEKGLGTQAGSHWDPQHTGKHSVPWDDTGHLGDLPPLYVAANGTATQPVMTPKIKDINQLKGHSLMIHYGGDNHSDNPKKFGGGGARMVCGVIK